MKRTIYFLILTFLLHSFNLSGSDLPIIFEAESGTIGQSFAVAELSGVTYVTIKPTLGGTKPDSARRVITYTVTFSEAGTYDLYARFRIGANTFDDDSYYYGNGFGTKDVSSETDWIRCNMLSGKGYSAATLAVEGTGNSSNQEWVWLNMSEFTGDEAPITFTVTEGNLTQTFQIAGREDGIFFDKFAFGKSDLYFTVDNLNKGQAGSIDKPGEEPKLTPIASGQTKFLGCAYGSDSKYNFASYWNQVTPGNSGKWGSVEGTRDVMNWTELDEAYNFALKNKFPFKYHNLIWGQQQPTWIETLDSAQQRQEIEEWFAAVADRYDTLDFIDVVNEPLHEYPGTTGKGNYAKALGGTGVSGWDWVINSFKLARQYFPKSKLILNEYNVTNSMENTKKLVGIVKLLQKESLIDGIGIQAHAFSTNNATSDAIKASLDTLAKTGLSIYPSELDIDGATDAAQVKEYMRVFPIFWNHPDVAGITVWGYRPGMWRSSTKAYIINSDRTMRPAMLWLRAYVEGSFIADETITISPAGGATTISAAGDSLQMSAVVKPDDATLQNVVWTTNNSKIAVITETGKLIAKGNGIVTVTASSMELGSVVKGEIQITISNQPSDVRGIENSYLSVYPNPADDELNLKNASDIVAYEIINFAGQTIISNLKNENNTINISGLSKGLYIFKVTDKTGKSISLKFIKK